MNRIEFNQDLTAHCARIRFQANKLSRLALAFEQTGNYAVAKQLMWHATSSENMAEEIMRSYSQSIAQEVKENLAAYDATIKAVFTAGPSDS